MKSRTSAAERAWRRNFVSLLRTSASR